MSLVAGAVSVDPGTGAVTGTGAALALYLAEASSAYPYGGVAGVDLEGDLEERVAEIGAGLPWLDASQLDTARAVLLDMRQRAAARATAQAAAIVALVQTATVTTVVPSTPGTFVGVVT